MKTGLYKLFCIAVMILVCMQEGVFAQSSKKDLLKLVLHQLQDAYNNAGYLEVDLRYTYIEERSPLIVLDSVSGKLAIQGNSYDLLLANTETVNTGRYLINIFNDDKVIYVNKPGSSASGNPLLLIDSVLNKIAIADVTVVVTDWHKTVTVIFPENATYKKMVLQLDAKTGLLTEIQYLVQSSLLTGVEAPDAGYAIVKASFTNYRLNRSADDRFKDENFFRSNINGLEPAERFKNYQVYKNSPNL